VQCFLYTDNGIFLEYMRGTALIYVSQLYLLTATLDGSLCSRIQNNHTADLETRLVTKVDKLEPLALRKEWMNDLTQAVAFLESLTLAHGDLRPENILLDRNRLKLSDFDCTAEVGADFEACMAPYGRLLNSDEVDQGRRGSSGFLGSRTEQFALGSVFYYINYGFEVYGNQCLTENPKDHGPKVVDLLQDMVFPSLDGDPLIDDIIDKCWHNKYATVAELATYTNALFLERNTGSNINTETHPVSECGTDETTKPEAVDSENPDGFASDMGQYHSLENFSSKKGFCQSLEKSGLLEALCSGPPKQLGFPFTWYRYSKR
jgi:serine/threonine protein kinase